MHLRKFAFVAALVWAAAAFADVQPAVQPGGDIPPKPPNSAPAIPWRGDIPTGFHAPRGEFQYVRRTEMIPMRDGVKLYTVLIVPKTPGRFPIMLDRSP